MKRITLIICGLLSLILAPSINAANSSNNDIVERAAAKVRQAPALTIGFTATVGGDTADGTILVAGDRFRLSTSEIQTWYDGKSQWTYSAADNEVTITEPTVDELAQVNPFAIVTSLRVNFRHKVTSTKNGMTSVVFTPKDKNNSIKKLTVDFNSATAWPESVNLTSDSDQTVRLKIVSIKEGSSQPSPAEFIFNPKKFPGIEIVDLR